MISANLSIGLAVLILVFTVADPAIRSNFQPISRFAESIGTPYKSDCKNDIGMIEMALQKLSSGEYNQTETAKKKLRHLASKSIACRQELVSALMGRMDKPDLDFERQPSHYYLWREGAPLLGEFNAIEALDLLISHLDMTNGFHSTSMVFQPAVVGVHQMGQAAIPKLALALQHNPKARIRIAAAYCLTSIGGESAMNALKQVEQKETNACVANFVRISLNTFTYKSKHRISFDSAAPQANTQARQTWLMAFECVE